MERAGCSEGFEQHLRQETKKDACLAIERVLGSFCLFHFVAVAFFPKFFSLLYSQW